MVDGSRRHFSCCFSFLLWLLQASTLSYGVQKLRMVNVVYRHGDRSPVGFFPADEHQDYWPQGPGQLSQIGMKQEYELGKFLKDRYVTEYKLLNSSYLLNEIYVRSSDKDRCIMSAQTQLNGLYPPHGKQIWRDNLDWQPIGVHVVPRTEDYLLRPFDYKCPRLLELLAKSKEDKEYLDMAKQNEELLSYVSTHAKMKVTVDTAHRIYDTLFCEKSHNLTLPAWSTNGTTWAGLRNLSYFNMMWLFKSPERAKLTGGNLVGAIVNNMKDYLKPTSKKLYIYSAHDTTVSALLSALDVYDGIAPAYSSAVMIELFSDENDNKKNLTVRIMYRYGQSSVPRKLKLATCSEFCPLDDFIKKTADVIPDDIDKACGVGNEEEEKCVRTEVYKSFLAAFVAVTVLLGLILMCLCIRCCRQRCCRGNNLTVYNTDLLKDARLLDKQDYDSDT
ncbi:prostatic acid phosphatase-like [Orbicella faveolata]|uniref:prostatic acid phosphatase-like n=1 Tax=Orbicella faveolata TaxID=48498 RepID=UPI0009E4B63F|nr:prostatic acid phosphatase-like [Orbicella faveolata]